MRERVDERMRERCGVEKEERGREVEGGMAESKKRKRRTEKEMGKKDGKGEGDRREGGREKDGGESYGGREGRKRWVRLVHSQSSLP